MGASLCQRYRIQSQALRLAQRKKERVKAIGGAPSVPIPKAPDASQEYQQSLGAYVGQAPALYNEESTYQPLYNQMQQQIQGSNIGYYASAIENQLPGAQNALQGSQNMAIQNAIQQYGNNAGSINQMVMSNNPALQQIQSIAQQQQGATSPDQTLQGLLNQSQQQTAAGANQLQGLASQAGSMFNQQNAQLQGLSNQAGAYTGQGVADLRGVAGQAAADTRSDIFNQTKGAVMGQLGNLDPVTQQLSDMAQQQLSLGGQVSQQGLQDADQAARAAFSARGMLNSTGSIAGEVLNRDAVQQARLQQRQQFGMGVGGMVNAETNQRTANALGLTQTDINATQQNQALAGQMYQAAGQLGQAGTQLQGGLQGQISSNIGSAMQQQSGLTQAAIGVQQQGTQQAQSLQGGILDQIYRNQQAASGNQQYLYGAQSAAQGALLGAQSGGAQMLSGIMGDTANMGTGSPNLFQGSGLLSLTSQNQMAQMNATASANQMNSKSKGDASGAMIGAGAAVASAAVVGVALF